MITSALAKAVERAGEASVEEQERIAALIIEELESDKKWEELFARSQDKLAKMASQAIAEHRAGKTIPLPDLGP